MYTFVHFGDEPAAVTFPVPVLAAVFISAESSMSIQADRRLNTPLHGISE